MTPEPIPPALLRVADAASYLAVSVRTIWNLIHDGRLPAVRFGRVLRIERADLDRFIEKAKGSR